MRLATFLLCVGCAPEPTATPVQAPTPAPVPAPAPAPASAPAPSAPAGPLGAARLLAPITGAGVFTTKPSFLVALPPGADSFEVQTCSDRACASPLGKVLPVGRVFYRARAVRAGATGEWTRTWQIVVRPGSTNADTSAIAFSDPSQDELRKRYGNDAVAIGDVDGDGFSDAWVKGAVCGGVPDGKCGAANSTPGHVIELGDVNRDGFADVVISGDKEAWFFAGGPSGLVQTSKVSRAATIGGRRPQGFDFNGDGFMDYAASGYGGPGTMQVHLGSKDGLHEKAEIDLETDGTITGGFADSVAYGDVNGDGFSDIVIGDYYGGAKKRGRVYVFLGGKTPSKTAAFTIEEQDSTKDAKVARFGFNVDARDADNDGIDDVYVRTSCYMGEKESGACKGPFEYMFKGARDGLKLDKPVVTKK
jgi:hypothetical protein